MSAQRRPIPGRAGHPAELQEEAHALRERGVSRAEISRQLGVTATTVTRWLGPGRGPAPDDEDPADQATTQRPRRQAIAAYRRTVRERWAHQQAEQDAHRDAVGPLSDRELLLVGAALYWAEGSKSKPWQRRERIVFVNSDPGVVRVFLAVLDLLGVDRGRLTCSVSLHESHDGDVAREWWRKVVGPDLRFSSTRLKRHEPRTDWTSRTTEYHGCLTISVSSSAPEYRRLEGTWHGIVDAVAHGGAARAGGPAPVVPDDRPSQLPSRHPGARGYPRALRDEAARLRRDGVGRSMIARTLGVSAPTVGRWFREDRVEGPVTNARGHVPGTDSLRETIQSRRDPALREQDAVRRAVGPLGERELHLVGSALHRAEGASSKPWNRAHRIQVTNSDAGVIHVLLAWLRSMDVPQENLRCFLAIHAGADVAAASRYWLDVLGPGSRLASTTVKPDVGTSRHNVGEYYHGTLAVGVLQSAALYRWSAGTWDGVVASMVTLRRSPVV